MLVRILKIEPQRAGGNKVTVAIRGVTAVLLDPEDKANGKMLKKEVDVKICGLEGRAKSSNGPAQFDERTITAKVLEKDEDYVVLDCGLFSFDYMMNIGEADEFVVGEFIELESPRLDIMF
jgi:hypothetical protein